ncbi:hypothetical protein D3C81_1303760 [compost metagenome]
MQHRGGLEQRGDDAQVGSRVAQALGGHQPVDAVQLGAHAQCRQIERNARSQQCGHVQVQGFKGRATSDRQSHAVQLLGKCQIEVSKGFIEMKRVENAFGNQVTLLAIKADLISIKNLSHRPGALFCYASGGAIVASSIHSVRSAPVDLTHPRTPWIP